MENQAVGRLEDAIVDSAEMAVWKGGCFEQDRICGTIKVLRLRGWQCRWRGMYGVEDVREKPGVAVSKLPLC